MLGIIIIQEKLLVTTIIFSVLSLIFRQRYFYLSFTFLMIAAFSLRWFFADFDPFLHDWDERFHALVAKNMMANPFKPMLYANPILEYDYKNWGGNHIWLHKQPFFLWQIALSMKIFGANLFALRLPSILMGTLLLIPVYRTALIIFNEKTAYFAGFVMVFPFYQLVLISGVVGMDHNDVAFIFYIFLSIWCYFEYERSDNKAWLIGVGVFSGFAILTKWMVGLLVYAGWGANLLLVKEKRKKRQSWIKMTLTLLLTIAIVLPWQIYVLNTFPIESRHEFASFSSHLTHAVEFHKGAWAFHFQRFDLHYGIWSWLVLPFMLMILFFDFRRKEKVKFLLPFLTFIIVVYVFFSFIVAAKLPSFVYIVSPLIMIAFAHLLAFIDEKLNHIYKSRFWEWIMLILAAVFFLQPNSFEKLYIDEQKVDVVAPYNHKAKLHNTAIIKKLGETLPADYIIFNCVNFQEIDVMFYTDNIAYFWITQEQYIRLKSEGMKMAAFKDHNLGNVPFYLKGDPETLIIDKELIAY